MLHWVIRDKLDIFLQKLISILLEWHIIAIKHEQHVPF